MDSNYIVNRLKVARYKYPTAEVLKTRLINLDPNKRYQIVSSLKNELCKECNLDIYEQLFTLVHRLPMAS